MPFLPRSRQQGFTLIELLIVIVVGSILAIISVRFISESSRMLLDSGARQQLAATGSVISEKISRLLRPALPGSIRTTADGRCIEFIPVNVASVYTDLELNAPISGFSAVPVSETQTNSGYAVIYPISQNELYNPSARGALTQAVATLPARTAGTAAVTVSLSSAHEFYQTLLSDAFIWWERRKPFVSRGIIFTIFVIMVLLPMSPRWRPRCQHHRPQDAMYWPTLCKIIR
ncbi:MAG: type II secretion system GspH family protein [Saccharospirillaceae bacterium]|nr:type II secretion system GspH family protein [Saccharospirillaceae bacterium]